MRNKTKAKLALIGSFTLSVVAGFLLGVLLPMPVCVVAGMLFGVVSGLSGSKISNYYLEKARNETD